jgi:hypothetical protein
MATDAIALNDDFFKVRTLFIVNTI